MKNTPTHHRLAAAMTATAALLVLAVATPALAHPGRGDRRGARGSRDDVGHHHKRHAHMKARRGKMLRKHAGLDEATARRVEAVFERHEPARKRLRMEARTHRQALRELMRADSNDQAAYKRALDAMIALRVEREELRHREVGELRGVLTPKQQAKVLSGLRKMRRDHRHHRRGKRGARGERRARGERGERRGPPPGFDG